LVFYLLAMQCMSTLAVVKKETGSWKWPIIQLVYMTVIAYVLSFVAYQIFS
jgi:ferrous iron transport protein B